jgi:membrane protein DedA with SNARE-associated domain
MTVFTDLDLAWLAKLFSLAVLPFAHEDLAIVMGGYIIVNHVMPIGLVVVCIYFGMVASDFALYGIGAGARRLPWLSRWAVDDRVRNFADALKRNLFGLMALCRVVPGVEFVAFIACGWNRVPLGRFTLASFLVSALYLPLMLYLVIVFGDALDDHVGLWTWPFLMCLLAAAGFMRHRVFTLREDAPAVPAAGNSRPPARLPRASAVSLLRVRMAPLRASRVARLSATPRVAKWLRLS